MTETFSDEDTVPTPEAPDEGLTADEARGDQPEPEGRGRSTVTFPYAALSDGEAIAHELQTYGGAASPEDLAAALGQKARSGAFRQKVSAARLFGLVEVTRGEVSLAPLGRKILNPGQRDEARVGAFLNVPLYEEVFNAYRGAPLPKPAPLDAFFVRKGVSQKSAPTARQVFVRSADLAGFFRRDPGRLTLPALGGSPVAADDQQPPPERTPRDEHSRPGAMPLALEMLWLTLLRDGADWDAARVKAFVDHARGIYAALEP